jgi:NAD(P)-dependent dehydrogenase (short-subunit alcohol dehydrogenase family)
MITGASLGFGAKIAEAVLDVGDRVVATARKLHALDHLPASGSALKLAMDVTDETRVKAAVDAALDHFGRTVAQAQVLLRIGYSSGMLGEKFRLLCRVVAGCRRSSPKRRSLRVGFLTLPFWFTPAT